MTWVAVAVAGGAVVGAVVTSNGAKHAASTQAGAARDASQVQWNIFQQTNENQQPYIQAGYGASDVLSRLLGIRPSGNGAGGGIRALPGSSSQPQQQFGMPNTQTGFRVGAPGTAGTRIQPRLGMSPIGPSTEGRFYNSDGTVNEAAARRGATPSSNTFDMAQGSDGVYSMDNTGLDDGYLTQRFGPQQFAEGIDPGYGWRFQQGVQAVSNGAAPSIGSLSGPALKALMDYGQGEASQEYGAAFNRFQTQQGNIFQRLSSIASLGQNAAANVGNQGVVTGGNIGSNIVGAGNASAAGQIGAANAWSNAAGTLASIPYLRSTAAAQGG